MFNSKSKLIDEQKEVIRNQRNTVDNLNDLLKISREENQRLSSQLRDMEGVIVKKDEVIDRIEKRRDDDVKLLANMLSCFGFNHQKIKQFVDDRGDESGMWISAMLRLLKHHHSGTVSQLVNMPLTDIDSRLDGETKAQLIGDRDDERLRQLGWIIMQINDLSRADRKVPQEPQASDRNPPDRISS